MCETKLKVHCFSCEILSSHGGEYEVQNCLLGCTARSSETSVDNYFTRQYIPEDNSESHFFSSLCVPVGWGIMDTNSDIVH
jgi:hypothetical protein